MILRQQAVLDYPTFPLILWLFRVLSEILVAILARSLTPGTHVACQETFLKIHLHLMNRQHLVPEMSSHEVLPLRMANLCV